MNFNDLSKPLQQQLLAAKELAANRLLRANFYGNVVGVGIGQKVVDGVPTETHCVRIYVQSKVDLDDVTPAYLLPSSFLDIPTDIIPVGRLGLAKMVGKPPKAQAGTIGPGSPIRLHSDHSNVNCGAGGTLGAIVEDDQGKPYILCCNHILNVNGRVNKDPKAAVVSGDPVFRDKAPKIGAPGDLFVPLKRGGNNEVDCALAEVDGALLQGSETPAADQSGKPPKPKLQAGFPTEIGSVDSTRAIAPSGDQKVRKAGAVTGLTRGTIVDVHADFYIDYGFGTFRFTNQVVIDGKGEGNPKDIFATDGDSGAIVVDEKNRAVAMIFAEAGRFALACPFREVLKQISLLISPDSPGSVDFGTLSDSKTPEVRPMFKIVNRLSKETGALRRSMY